jgi:hypothetical protein
MPLQDLCESLPSVILSRAMIVSEDRYSTERSLEEIKYIVVDSKFKSWDYPYKSV